VDGYIALKHPAAGSLFCASESRQDAKLLGVPPAGFTLVPAAGNDGVELEHADNTAERTATAVSRGRINASTFRKRSEPGGVRITPHGNG
jgi:hypothetical protein